MTRPTTLAAWLAYLEMLHPKAIALGLERVRAVFERMGIVRPDGTASDRTGMMLACPILTVTGTNGKGSTCALLESMLLSAGHRTGLYTSPHLISYNERVRIGGEEVADDQLIDAFNAVEDARADVPLTYFEYGTLAALWLFARAELDAVVLEVGLGGRLDAVNIVDADIAVVTSVDLDHMDYLGPTREDIGREKAGIFRAGRPVVCAEPSPPATMIAHARVLAAPVTLIGRDYGYRTDGAQWEYWGPGGRRFGLPHPALRGAIQLVNAATAIAALDLLRDHLHVSAGAVRDGLVSVQLAGRFQVLPGRPAVVLDVAHNPHAARVFAAALGTMGYHPETIAVFGIFADKDIAGVINAMRPRIDRWHVATLPGPRGAGAVAVRAELRRAGVAPEGISAFDDVGAAFRAARERAGEADRIIVFGSFLTVAAALAAAKPGAARTNRHG
jgi:dihydrofolate synthase/folylpolyglutamate synthase